MQTLYRLPSRKHNLTMQTLIFKGPDVERIVQAGLISTQMAMFTAQDDVKVRVYRGDKNVITLKVVIRKKKEDAKDEIKPSIQ